MPKQRRPDRDTWVQFCTRIPKPLWKRMKIQTTQSEVQVTDFVTAAITERLAREGGSKRDDAPTG